VLGDARTGKIAMSTPSSTTTSTPLPVKLGGASSTEGEAALWASKTGDRLNAKALLSPKLKRYVDINIACLKPRDAALWQHPDTAGALLSRVSTVFLPCSLAMTDPVALRQTIVLARHYHCELGAHLAYPSHLPVPTALSDEDVEHLATWLLVQLGAYRALLNAHGLELETLRPDGALYWALMTNERLAQVVCATLHTYQPWCILVAPYGSACQAAAAPLGLRIANELSVGCHYNELGQPNPARRTEPLSVAAALDQAKGYLNQQQVLTSLGQPLSLAGNTVHTLHVSLAHPNPLAVLEGLNTLIEQPVPIPLALVGKTGWVETFDDRSMAPPTHMAEPYWM
jgi:UPF0271 protein